MYCGEKLRWSRKLNSHHENAFVAFIPPPQKKKQNKKQKKPANSDQFIPRCKTKYLLLAPKEVDQGPLIHDDIPRFFCPVLRLKETKIIQNLFLFRKILT